MILDVLLRIQHLLLKAFDYLLKFKFLFEDQLIVIPLTLQLIVETIDCCLRGLRLALVLDALSLDLLELIADLLLLSCETLDIKGQVGLLVDGSLLLVLHLLDSVLVEGDLVSHLALIGAQLVNCACVKFDVPLKIRTPSFIQISFLSQRLPLDLQLLNYLPELDDLTILFLGLLVHLIDALGIGTIIALEGTLIALFLFELGLEFAVFILVFE